VRLAPGEICDDPSTEISTTSFKIVNNSGIFFGSEKYAALLERANQRMVEPLPQTNAVRSPKYTARHDDLIVDVVKTFYNMEESLAKQYEVFKSLLKDLDMLGMPKGTFLERAGAIRRRIPGYCCQKSKRLTICEDSSKLSESFSEVNLQISDSRFGDETGIARAEENGQQTAFSSIEQSDEDFWNDVDSILKDLGEENAQSLSSVEDEPLSSRKRKFTQY
jgi:hypothetical protein